MTATAVKRVEAEKVRIPCPVCARRIFDWQGEAPTGNWSQQMKCRECGFVWVTSAHIRRHLTGDGKIARI